MANIAEPKCPECLIEGKDSFAVTDSRQRNGPDALFLIAHCASCGHVYGVFPKAVHKVKLERSTVRDLRV